MHGSLRGNWRRYMWVGGQVWQESKRPFEVLTVFVSANGDDLGGGSFRHSQIGVTYVPHLPLGANIPVPGRRAIRAMWHGRCGSFIGRVLRRR